MNFKFICFYLKNLNCKLKSMQTWVNFWTFFFWLSLFLFFLNASNFLTLLFYSELVWIILYCFTALLCGCNDDILLLCTTFFLLALAGLEFSLGFLLIILFKNINKTLNLDSRKKNPLNFWVDNHNKLYLNKIKFSRFNVRKTKKA